MKKLPLVSVVIPAFNEAGILEANLGTLLSYMKTLEDRYQWELVLVNDGSTDETGKIADRVASGRPEMRVFHHPQNFGLGQAFRYAFAQCKGDYVVTLDIDLSYSPDHIGRLLDRISTTKAKLVLASPYMKGGKTSNVPFMRRLLSVVANRFLAFFVQDQLSTLTCMVRAYDGPFIRSINLRSMGMDVMPETVYKAMILRAKIEQIPAHLDWALQRQAGAKRQSSMKVLRHILATVLAGFIFRPFMFFVLPGLLLLAFSAYVNTWMIIHFVHAYLELKNSTGPYTMSAAIAIAYEQNPHTFIVGLLSLMLSIQLVSLGILALQSKAYFEELFHLGSGIRRHQIQSETERFFVESETTRIPQE